MPHIVRRARDHLAIDIFWTLTQPGRAPPTAFAEPGRDEGAERGELKEQRDPGGIGIALTARAEPGRDPARLDVALGGRGVIALRALLGAPPSELPYALRTAPLLPNSPLVLAARLLPTGVEGTMAVLLGGFCCCCCCCD